MPMALFPCFSLWLLRILTQVVSMGFSLVSLNQITVAKLPHRPEHDNCNTTKSSRNQSHCTSYGNKSIYRSRRSQRIYFMSAMESANLDSKTTGKTSSTGTDLSSSSLPHNSSIVFDEEDKTMCTTNSVASASADVTSRNPNGDMSTSGSPAEKSSEVGEVRRFPLFQQDFFKTKLESKTLSEVEQERLRMIMKFKYLTSNVGGRLVVRAMRLEQLKDLENLLTDSYSDLMWGPLTYRPALSWILASYLRERQAYLPNAVTLVGLYEPAEDGDGKRLLLAGAVEISLNSKGKPKDMQTPLPPEDAPFLSNMAVLKKFRRRGIGRELLKAAEQLTIHMGCKEMYLHCRMIDEAPLNMYKKSGYAVVDTNSVLSLLTFQRRRHLMYKALETSTEADSS